MAPKLFAATNAIRLTGFMAQPLSPAPRAGWLPAADRHESARPSPAPALRGRHVDEHRPDCDHGRHQNVFGTVSHETLLGTLAPPTTCQRFQDRPAETFTSPCNVHVLPDSEGDLVAMERGVQQGSPHSPVVIVTAIDPALHAVEAADRRASALGVDAPHARAARPHAGAERPLHRRAPTPKPKMRSAAIEHIRAMPLCSTVNTVLLVRYNNPVLQLPV